MRYLIGLSFLLLMTTSSITAQAVTDRPLITVAGQAEIKVVPDEVGISLHVNNLDKILAAAKKLNDEKVGKVLALTQKYNIAPENVQTASFDISTEYRELQGRDGESKGREFRGYQISKKIVIVLKDLTRLEGLLSDLIDVGVNGIDDVDFRTTKSRQFRDEARALAIKAAQEKAIALTKEIVQSIGKAYSITEGEVASAYSNNLPANNSRYRSSSFEPDGSPPFIGSTVAIGQISVTATVIVSFELR